MGGMIGGPDGRKFTGVRKCIWPSLGLLAAHEKKV
jgi:hypothetical protein